MTQYFCYGKNGICENDTNCNRCVGCEFFNGSGGIYLENDSALVRCIKREFMGDIFEEIWASIATRVFTAKSEDYADGAYDTIEWVDSKIAEVEKKYTEELK